MSTIVVGCDGSPGSVAALAWAAGEARRLGAEIHAVCAYRTAEPVARSVANPSTSGGRSRAAQALAHTIGAVPLRGLTVRAAVHEGWPSRVLLDSARAADILVVGARSSTASTRAGVGSVGRHCADLAMCPVVIVPPDVVTLPDAGAGAGAGAGAEGAAAFAGAEGAAPGAVSVAGDEGAAAGAVSVAGAGGADEASVRDREYAGAAPPLA